MADHLRVTSVTGVDLDLPLAGPGGRSYAFIIDWHIRTLLALAWLLIVLLGIVGVTSLQMTEMLQSNAALYFAALPATAIYFGYHPVLEWWMDGQTPGKKMAGIRIVTRSGESPSPGAILIRNVFRLVDALPVLYCVGLAATLVTRNQVRIGDLAAGTVLVYQEASPKRELSGIVPLAGTLQLSRELVELVRDTLERWPLLERELRGRLARNLLAKAGVAAISMADADLRQQLQDVLDQA